ncbi:MAG: tRNA (N6-threonylcarbamoyladenosine(37)-N6)-methyltransferase TrmO [Coriobacteriia bacterium]|nr:tRNA (N6-threonylcarbamoyladenosine(37)-N6)-methyltransferase TrmO [Coriobacteriia bacterium]
MFEPIGIVRSPVTNKVDHDWGAIISQVVIDEPFADGLQGLKDFSHIIVVYHLDQARFQPEEHLQRHPQEREDLPCVGIFSQRAKDRPNPIGITAVRLLSVHDNEVEVQGLDAIDGTPVLDIKPYFPQYDLKENAQVPDWVNVLMKDYF